MWLNATNYTSVLCLQEEGSTDVFIFTVHLQLDFISKVIQEVWVVVRHVKEKNNTDF